MTTTTRLFKIGSFNFNLYHFLVIGVLVLAFSASFLIRSQGADYGFELNEFDPFFNFRATEFLVENGITEYFDWYDEKSWYPEGRNVSATSQVMLHVTAASTYLIFGGDSSLYDFTILFPVIFGSLTVIVIFALVRVIGGTTAGLFAAILFSVSLPILLRGSIGWFKSEPLGIFYGLLGLYFFLSGIKSENKKIAISKLIAGGIIMAIGLSSWGGIQFFVIPIGIFILILPFVRKDHEFIIWSIPTFVSTFLLTSLMFEFVGTSFVFGFGGFSLIIPTVFLVTCIIIQKFSKVENKTRNGLIFMFVVIIIGSFLITINEESKLLPIPQFRYLNAINPFLTTTDPLVDSVAEHATTTLAQSFFFHSILMIFAGLGIWIILSKRTNSISYVKNDMIIFSLIIGLTGVYVSSAFVRLEVFASISLVILASIGLSILVKNIVTSKNIFEKFRTENFIKILFLGGIVILLVLPLMYPASNWATSAKAPPTILNGGTPYGISTNDWTESLDWIKNNTPEGSVVAAWWDYGYWITTMSDRTTLADNFTADHNRIKKIAQTLLSPPDKAWDTFQGMGADYVVVFVAGQRIDDGQDQLVYILNGGGDESKKQWFIRIAEEPFEKYLHPDNRSGTDNFWNNTLLGKLFPFSVLTYIDPSNTSTQSQTWQPGLAPIYGKDIKYPVDSEGPFRLVHSSPSFTNESRTLIGVFIYEINDNYVQ